MPDLLSLMQLDDAWRPANPSDEDMFYSLQYALYSLFVLLVMGGLFFLYTARYIIADRNAAKMQMHSGTWSESQSLLHSESVSGSSSSASFPVIRSSYA